MTRTYSTDAIVLGSRKLGEADRIVDLFTSDLGRVPTVVKGVRKVKSRWGGRLEPFTFLKVQMHSGRNLDTLTSADTVKTHSVLRDRPVFLRSGLSVVEMITRTTPERHRKPRTYNLAISFLEEMDRQCDRVPAPPAAGGVNGGSAALLALSAQLKMLLLAGFLPHLLSCAHCGSADNLVGFSAAVGGALCSSCGKDSFEVASESLEAMRHMLEEPLSAAAGLSVGEENLREVRRAIREICGYHLGVRLKVEPW